MGQLCLTRTVWWNVGDKAKCVVSWSSTLLQNNTGWRKGKLGKADHKSLTWEGNTRATSHGNPATNPPQDKEATGVRKTLVHTHDPVGPDGPNLPTLAHRASVLVGTGLPGQTTNQSMTFLLKPGLMQSGYYAFVYHRVLFQILLEGLWRALPQGLCSCCWFYHDCLFLCCRTHFGGLY